MDAEKFNEDLKSAPWNVMDTFDTLDDKVQLLGVLVQLCCREAYAYQENEVQKNGRAIYDTIMEKGHQDEKDIC